VRSLEGASTFYNTYWVRFPYKKMTFDQAIQHALLLFSAAREAGVRRVVHVSITHPSEDSPLPYFRGKARLERALKESGLSYAIIRPTVIFGREDILINNIEWFLRTLPFFAVAGSGRYRIQPVYVEDVAGLAVDAGHGSANTILDAVGPETYPYEEFVRLIAQAIGSSARIVHVLPPVALLLATGLDLLVHDVVLTRDEIEGLMSGLLVSNGPPTGRTLFSHWLKQNADTVGRQYASELDRHYR
jgi:NADH dehydrogenase